MRFGFAWPVACLLLCAGEAAAQPAIIPVVRPNPNAEGWINSVVRVEYECLEAVSCPETAHIASQGTGQQVSASAAAADGQETFSSLLFNIDSVVPEVFIESAIPRTTALPSILVVARASDATSGVSSATCNGTPAPIDPTGRVRCQIALGPGVNDIVVEVSDHADNSGSAGARILRTTGSTGAQVNVFPAAAGVLSGQTRAFQVLDAAGAPVPDVEWHLDSPSLAEMSTDGRHVFTARATGVVTVTASYHGVTGSAVVTIYTGTQLPPNAVRWRIGTLAMIETPFSGPPKDTGKSALWAFQRPGQVTSLMSVSDSTGHLNWFGGPAVASSETILTLHEQSAGGAVLAVESQTAGNSALVRAGPSAQATPWRYRSAGILDPNIVMDAANGIQVMETGPGRFPQLLIMDGLTGVVRRRDILPAGVHVAINVGCINGANAARLVPAKVGPAGAQVDGSVRFMLVGSDDREDFERCGSVSGYLRRTVMFATMSPGVKNVDTLRVYEVPAGSLPPLVSVYPVSGDGHGGFLAPWSARYPDTGASESRVMHITGAGQQEYTLPAVGKVWLADKDDLALTTDGATIAVFNVLTGVLLHSHYYPKGVKIVSVIKGIAWINSANLDEVYDANGILERPKPPQ